MFCSRAERKILDNKKILEAQQEIEAKKASLEKANRKRIKSMLNTHCPIMKGLCIAECIHFSGGRVWSTQIMGDILVDKISPRCRLWK